MKMRTKMFQKTSQRRLRATFMACAMLLLGVFFMGSVSSAFGSSLDTGLYSYYDFDEGTGTNIIEKVTGTYNLTTANTPQWIAGKLGNALNFTQVAGQVASRTYANPTSLTSDFSISIWYRMYANNTNYQALISNRNGAEAGTWGFLSVIGDGYSSYVFQDTTGGGSGLNFGAGTFDNTWHNIVLTRSGNNFTAYRNGVYLISETKAINVLWNKTLNFGGDGLNTPATSTSMSGALDEIGIWNKALNLSEVQSLWNSGAGLSYTFGVGALAVTLNSPVNYFNTTTSQVIFNASVLALDSGQTVQNVSLYLDGILNQTNTSGINGTYTFTKYISSGTHNWSILAFNNNSISTQSETRNLTFGIFENSRTFSASKTEGTSGTFVLNLSVVSPVTLAYLNYNGTLKATNILAGAFTTLTSTFSIPSVSTDTNVTFFWMVYTALQNFNSTTSNQTILNVAIDNCTVNKIVLYNFTIVDEITQTKLVGSTGNTSGKINIQVYPFANYNAIFTNYSTFFNMTNPFAICVNSTLSAGDKFSIDAQIEYDALLNTKEYYYIQNDTLEPSYLNKNITLYDLDDTKAQTFKIVYLDSSGIPVEDALIEIQRQYVDEGVFKIVEIAKTDKDGETQAKLQLNDVVYTFVVKKYGRVIDTFNKKFVRCDNYVYNVCEIKLNSFSSYIQTEDYTKGDDFEFTLTYTRATRTITSVFNIPSGSSSLIVLNATLLDNLGTTLACSSSITSSSGTLNCVVPNAIGNGTVYAQIFKDGVLQGSGDVSLNTKASDIYGASLVFLLIFLYLTLIGMGVGDSPMVMGVFMILGVILAVALNLVDTGASKFFGAGATILWFIIAVVIVLIKGGKR